MRGFWEGSIHICVFVSLTAFPIVTISFLKKEVGNKSAAVSWIGFGEERRRTEKVWR